MPLAEKPAAQHREVAHLLAEHWSPVVENPRYDSYRYWNFQTYFPSLTLALIIQTVVSPIGVLPDGHVSITLCPHQ